MQYNKNLINSLAEELKPQLLFRKGSNLKVPLTHVSQFNSLIEALYPLIIICVKSFINRHRAFNLTEADLISISLKEGLYKAFKLHKEGNKDYIFTAVFCRSLKYVFLTHLRNQMANKRKSITTSVYLETSPPAPSFGTSPMDKLIDSELLDNLKANLTKEEFLIATILICAPEHHIGETFAKAFNKPSYDVVLRKKVERAKKKIANTITYCK